MYLPVTNAGDDNCLRQTQIILVTRSLLLISSDRSSASNSSSRNSARIAQATELATSSGHSIQSWKGNQIYFQTEIRVPAVFFINNPTWSQKFNHVTKDATIRLPGKFRSASHACADSGLKAIKVWLRKKYVRTLWFKSAWRTKSRQPHDICDGRLPTLLGTRSTEKNPLIWRSSAEAYVRPRRW